MIPQFNAIVLDVILVVALLGLAALGVFKGVKHTLINIGLLIVALVIGFMPFTNVIKAYLAGLLGSMIKIGSNVSYSAEAKISMSMLYMFMATMIFTILVYIIIRLIKLLIVKLYRRNYGIGRIQLTPVSRVFGGIFGFLIHGVMLIFLLSLADNPLVGVDKTYDNSYVSQYIVRADNMLIDAFGGDSEKIEANITILALKGNVLAKVKDEDIQNFIGMTDVLGNSSLAPKGDEFDEEDAKLAANQIEYILNAQQAIFMDENGNPLAGFEEMKELTADALNKAISQMVTLHGEAEDFEGVENAFNVILKLEKLYGVAVAEKFASLFVI